MVDLPLIMSSLDICDQQMVEEAKQPEIGNEIASSSRVLRKRINSGIQPHSPKRRCRLKPIKYNAALSENKIKNLYLNQNCRSRALHNLETIFEEPKVSKGDSSMYVGTSKQRRINFNITKNKLKKRKTKVKKVLGCKTASTKKKPRLTMKEFLAKLHGLINNSVDNSHNVFTTVVSCSPTV